MDSYNKINKNELETGASKYYRKMHNAAEQDFTNMEDLFSKFPKPDFSQMDLIIPTNFEEFRQIMHEGVENGSITMRENMSEEEMKDLWRFASSNFENSMYNMATQTIQEEVSMDSEFGRKLQRYMTYDLENHKTQAVAEIQEYIRQSKEYLQKLFFLAVTNARENLLVPVNFNSLLVYEVRPNNAQESGLFKIFKNQRMKKYAKVLGISLLVICLIVLCVVLATRKAHILNHFKA
ncbi:uncharacterized protein NESG_02202 [Nematocida ausubeli]|uniref:Uncharacterized protein n=1 Tax=Nematocida ausubeli (strain ATCC PRA-371 / ERTm2) TaxID=1913371 RepID=A0A086IZW0_NEMA1|nr:uncharacterized protein NESG_02202 [Nematocida ausubeli]KFG25428.1 hypothetical protein NESG_02202 [Nematocida ausubeli]